MEDFGSIAASRIALADTPDFALGGMRVRPAHREVVFNGEVRELEPKVMQVLVALAVARPDVVSRDRLIEQCWNGRIVGDDAVNRCIIALRHLARDVTPAPFAIKTVPRVGYALTEGTAAVAGGGSEAFEGHSAPRNRRFAPALLAFLVLAVLVAGFALWRFNSATGRDAASSATPASLAVLPFRNLSRGDPYFAEGIGEEILAQLAREPAFRVAGRTSSAQFRNAADLRKVGRALDVDYVLEGSVRAEQGRVRVNAALVQTSDGMRLWSETFDRQLDDIFEIQNAIGASVAGALRKALVRSTPSNGPLVTNGEAYNRYLTARGLIRTRDPDLAKPAVDLLREAIKLDPGYAPAWSSLAQAIRLTREVNDPERLIAMLPLARTYARHALKLAPDLAEAHGTQGMLLGYASPQAQAHLRRAAALDPRSAENLIWLGIAYKATGRFEDELAAYRRAFALDPLWNRTARDTAVTLAEMGRRADAEAFLKRRPAPDKSNQQLLLARIALISGDFSEAARYWRMVAEADASRWGGIARESMKTVLFTLGLPTEPPQAIWTVPGDAVRPIRRVWMKEPPSPAEWRRRNRDPLAAEVYRHHNHYAAKLMLNAGRSDELAAAYAGPGGLLGMRPGQRLRVDQVGETAIGALALRASGRAADARRLLGQADMAIRSVHDQGEAPFWFDADAAAVRAVQGRRDEALAVLERALGSGWTHTETTDLADLADEPAFVALRGHPRFERIRERLVAHLARERQETRMLGR